jgi:hypothetical protein
LPLVLPLVRGRQADQGRGQFGELSREALAAELTNHLIEGVVLTPGAVAAIPELQKVCLHYIA